MSIEIMATKGELLKAIRNFCRDHCPGKLSKCEKPSCPLFNYRYAATKAPDQLHLFKIGNREDFFSNMLQAANSFGGRAFYWSELRKAVGAVPLNHNWYGGATNVLRKNGFRMIIGDIKKSEFKSRKSFDKKWQKIS